MLLNLVLACAPIVMLLGHDQFSKETAQARLYDFIHGPRGIRFGPFRLSLKQGPHADCVPEKN